MKKKFLKTLVALSLATSLFAAPVYASDYEFDQDSDYGGPVAVTVTAVIASEYNLAIPKNMVLTRQEDGTWGHDYTIDVLGYICEEETLSIVPQSEITLSCVDKEDVPVVISQPIQKIKSIDFTGELEEDSVLLDAEETPEISGKLSVKDGYRLTAGSWEGSLTFTISMDDGTGMN